MTRMNKNQLSAGLALAGLAFGALLTSSSVASVDDEEPIVVEKVWVKSPDDDVKPTTSRATVWVDDKGDIQFDGHTVEVRVENGEVSVKLDGKEVPKDRIRQKDGRLVIVDKDGNLLESIRIAVDTDQATDKWFGTDDYAFDWTSKDGKEAAAKQPKVMVGVFLDEPTRALAKHLKLERDATTMITALHKGLPAHKAGLDEFDIIVKIDGKKPADPKSLHAALAEKNPGDEICLTLIHEGDQKVVYIPLKAYDAKAMAQAELIGEAPAKSLVTDDFIFSPLGESGERDFLIRIPEMGLQNPPDMRNRLRLRDTFETDETTESDLQSCLDRLDRRLAELEKMLQRMLEEVGTDRRR